MTKTCKINNCNNLSKYSGYCLKHIIKDVSNIDHETMFREMIHHQRGVYKNNARISSKIFFDKKEECKNIYDFENLYKWVGKIMKENNMNGINGLTHYDITSTLARYHNIQINRVYYIKAKGPYKILERLNLINTCTLYDTNRLPYILVENVLDSLSNIMNITKNDIENNIGNINHNLIGDDIETYICWLASKN